MQQKVYQITLSIFIALFILSLSIAVPILVRGLYYGQIHSLNLVEKSGYSEETIIEAYDEMMDYCVKGGPEGTIPFGTGKLAWSESGKAHFDDVSKLFRLDINILKICTIVLIIFVAREFFGAKKEKRDYRIALGRGPFFWGPAGLLAVIAVIGSFAAVDFDRFFVAFHHIFFPGKENWIFDERYDEIIKILPEEVFRNFAIVIGIGVLVLCALSIIIDLRVKRDSENA